MSEVYPANRRTPAEWREYIREAWDRIAGGMLDTCFRLKAAKEAILTGELSAEDYARIVADLKIGFKLATEMIDVVASDRIGGDSVATLPRGLHSLLLLRRFDDEEFAAALAVGVIRPNVDRKELLSFRREFRLAKRQDEAGASGAPLSGGDYELLLGDLLDAGAAIPDASVDCIITDPPYPAEFLDCFSKLSELAARVLKPGASCIVMSGQSWLPEVLRRLEERLTYQWALAYRTPGQSTQVFGRRIKSQWKPLIWMVNGKTDWEHINDEIDASTENERFDCHHWGQSASGMAGVVERFTVRRQTVVDPFCGAGATGVAALGLGRRFVGIDIDPTHLAVAADRLAGRLADAA